MRDDFAIFILSHGRAGKVLTAVTLKKYGYTGNWYIIIDDEDSQIDRYYRIYGKEHIIMFSKKEYDTKFDIMDNFSGRQVPTFARNAVYDIAQKLNLKYFLEADDDLTCFRHRYLDKNEKLCTKYITDLDSVILRYLEYMDNTNITVLAFAQTGDLIGGKDSKMYSSVYRRKAMQGFFVRVSDRLEYIGRFNDDVNAYVEHGKRGKIFLTFRDIVMDTVETQVQSGGISQMYLTYGTYVKSFYSVMLCPSSVFIDMMGMNHRRIHHMIDWDTSVPKIISDTFKKGENYGKHCNFKNVQR